MDIDFHPSLWGVVSRNKDGYTLIFLESFLQTGGWPGCLQCGRSTTGISFDGGFKVLKLWEEQNIEVDIKTRKQLLEEIHELCERLVALEVEHTQRILPEGAPGASEERLRLFVDNSPLVAWMDEG